MIQPHTLLLQINTQNHPLSQAHREKIESMLHTLRKAVGGFPVAELHLDIVRYARTSECHVKTRLRLTKRTLTTGERSASLYTAVEHCVTKLLKQLTAYKETLGNHANYQLSTAYAIEPSADPNLEILRRAALDRDYPVFREAISVYDEPLQARVGRWVQGDPKIEARIGRDLTLTDIVEDIYLNAFEQFEARPSKRLGDWLEDLIDSSVHALVNDPNEKENVSFVQSEIQNMG